MQITLIQSEIEQALKNYINEQVNVKEGMEITIAFKATRGDEGNTAIIDIVPSAEKVVAVAAPATPTSRAKVTPVVKAAEPKSEPQPVKEDPPFVPDAKQPEAAASAPASSESTDGAAAQDSNAEVASADVPKKPSLFGNLGK